jgi:hypothetical protein
VVFDPHEAGVADRGGWMRSAGRQRPLSVQGEWAVRHVRVLFVAYLVLIAVGLAYFITLGVLHQ